MKKILVVGGHGQLGHCLQKIAPNYSEQYVFDFTDSDTLDITSHTALEEYFQENKVDFCINASAYTAVDLAETETEKAFAINAQGVANLAEICQEHKAIFIHISTDYVFDGDTNIPYSEENFTNPTSIYGISKLRGEELAMELCSNTIIIRTSWLYSEFNKNFVKTMLNLFTIKEELNIVNDQFGQPTNANDLAETIMHIVAVPNKIFGIFHFSNYPETTWYHFAEKIAEFSKSTIKLNAISTQEYPTPAKRPMRSTMCLDKIEEKYGIELKHWENSLQDCIEILNKKNEKV